MMARSIERSALLALLVFGGSGCFLAHEIGAPGVLPPAEPRGACPPDVVVHQRFAPGFSGELTACDTIAADAPLPSSARLGDVSIVVSVVRVEVTGDERVRVDVELDSGGTMMRVGFWRGAGRDAYWTPENGCVLDVAAFCAGDECAGIDVCGGVSCDAPLHGDDAFVPRCGGNPSFELRRWETEPDDEQAMRGVIRVLHIDALRILEVDLDAESGEWSTITFGRTHSVEELSAPSLDGNEPI